MYTIQRENGRIVVKDWNDKVIYSATSESFVIYRDSTDLQNEVQIARAKSLTDEQLLKALTNAVKFPL